MRRYVTVAMASLTFVASSITQAAPLAPVTSSRTTQAVPGCLPRYVAPTNVFGFQDSTKSTSDSGVMALTFLELTVFKQPVETVAGVDLSAANLDEIKTQIDAPALARCGAQFAFVRLTGLKDYVTVPVNFKGTMPVWKMWNDALAAGIEVYPYHYLYPPLDVLEGKFKGGFPYTTERRLALNAHFEGEGHRQAALFLRAYADHHLNSQIPSKIGFPKYIALDIEHSLGDQYTKAPGYGDQNRFDYAVAYGTEACVWKRDVEAALGKDAKILIYTNVNMDTQYNVLNIEYTGEKCLTGYPVWLALPTVHGGHFVEDARSINNRTIGRKICYSANAQTDRCVFHQYTQRGKVGLLDTRTTAQKKAKPLDIDLNRFHEGRIPWELFPAEWLKPTPSKSKKTKSTTAKALISE
jgi:hypothetical protein